MQSPIFSADTLFPVMTSEGRVMVKGATEPALFPGVKVKRLPEMVALMQVETRGGHKLKLSPESVFSLVKDDGKLVLFNPPVRDMSQVTPTSWRADINNDDEYRRWWTIGAMVSGGALSGERNVPGRLILPHDPDFAADYRLFLYQMSKHKDFRDLRGYPHAVNIQEIDERVIIGSRLLDKLVTPFLEPKTMRLFFNPAHLSTRNLHGFTCGLLHGSIRNGDGTRTLKHRDRHTLQEIHRALTDRAGIMGMLHVDPMEPDVQLHKAVTMPHHLLFDEVTLDVCACLGVLKGEKEFEEGTIAGLRRDDVIKVSPIGKGLGCIVLADGTNQDHATANWFLFNPRFEVSKTMTDVASGMIDPSDPAMIPRPQ